MDNAVIRDNINEAKDDFGVLDKNSLNDLHFSASDWRQAAAVFAPKPGQNDGFYITDNAQGAVTIHNNLTSATKEANNSYGQNLMNDVGGALALGAGSVGVIAASSAMATAETAFALDGATAGAALAAGAASVWPAVLIGGAIVGTVGTAWELASTAGKQAEARNDVASNQSFSFQSK